MRKLIWILVSALVLSACGGGLTSDKVISAFKEANLEAENPYLMTKDDYGLAPFVCEGTHFSLPSAGTGVGGRVFICDNEKDRDQIATYFTELGKISAMFYSWVYVRDNVVVMLNGEVGAETAAQYEKALNEAK